MSHAMVGHGRHKGRRASKLVVAVLAAVAFAAALRMGSGGRDRREASQLHRSIAAAAAGSAPTAAAASPAWAVENDDNGERLLPAADGTALPEPLDMPGAPAAAGRDAEQSLSARTAAPAGAEGLQPPTAGTQQPAASSESVEQQPQQAEEERDVAKQLAAPPSLPQWAAKTPQLPPPQQQQSAGQTAARTTAPDAGAALGIAKVALLFLTRGPMPLEPVWQEWLRGAEGLLPSFQLAAPGRCSQEHVDAVRALAGSSSYDSATVTGAALYRRQHLFSIYVHSPPEYPAYSEDSMFHGREASQRIATAWASHSLIAAVRLLLRDALADPLNKRFILMSESDVPLWPAGLFYLQSLAEPASRVHACGPGGAGWTDTDMADLLHIPREQWYKSSQWFAVNHRHAELFVNDTRLDPVFARDCYSEMDLATGEMKPGGRWCVSDEHYLPVLLATSGEAPAVACSAVAGGKGSPTFALWGQGGAPHPRTFIAREMSLGILRYVRSCSALAGEAALDRFPALLARPGQWSVAACQAAAAASAAAAQELTVAEQAAEAAAAARAAEAAALVAASGGPGPPPAASSNVLAAARAAAAAAVADQVVAGAVPLLPPYQCNLVLRKMAHDSADELAQKLREGLLLSRAAAAAAATAVAADATAAG